MGPGSRRGRGGLAETAEKSSVDDSGYSVFDEDYVEVDQKAEVFA